MFVKGRVDTALHDGTVGERSSPLRAVCSCRLCARLRDILQNLATQFARQSAALSVVVAKHSLRSLYTLVRHNACSFPLLVFADFLQCPLLAQVTLQTQYHDWKVLIIVEMTIDYREPRLRQRQKRGA